MIGENELEISFFRDCRSLTGMLPGSVLYVLEQFGKDLLPAHAALIVDNGSSSDRVRVFDWPDSLDTNDGKEQGLEFGRELKLGGKCICVARIDGVVNGKRVDIAKLFDRANRACSVGYDDVRLVQGTKDRYRVTPARPTLMERASETQNYFIGSCVGFVEECFEFAGFDIVSDSEQGLPLWTASELSDISLPIYGRFMNPALVRRLLSRQDQSIAGRVFLPGYQLNALLQRTIPYLPQSRADAYYREATSQVVVAPELEVNDKL